MCVPEWYLKFQVQCFSGGSKTCLETSPELSRARHDKTASFFFVIMENIVGIQYFSSTQANLYHLVKYLFITELENSRLQRKSCNFFYGSKWMKGHLSQRLLYPFKEIPFGPHRNNAAHFPINNFNLPMLTSHSH